MRSGSYDGADWARAGESLEYTGEQGVEKVQYNTGDFQQSP